MKLVIDERVKHRLIGLAVILSIGAIFAPAIMKKSNQRLDANVSVSVELPSKPIHPDIVMAEKNAMFEATKIAHVELPEVNDEQPHTTIAKAEPLSQMNRIEPIKPVVQPVAQVHETAKLESEPLVEEKPQIVKEKPTLVVRTTNVAVVKKIAKAAVFPSEPKPLVLAKNENSREPVPVPASAKSAVKVVKSMPKTAVLKNGYAVQLATFTRLKNAASLVSKLKKKGYTANYTKIKTGEGMVYKVFVGQVAKREQAELLQKQLVSAVQIKGFIVTTGQG